MEQPNVHEAVESCWNIPDDVEKDKKESKPINKIYLSPVVLLMNGQNFCIVFFVVNISGQTLKLVCVLYIRSWF